MKLQNYEKKNEKIRKKFEELKSKKSKKLNQRLNLSWSNWGFGMEDLAVSAKRLADSGVEYIELHGNHYGRNLGYKPKETLKILGNAGVRVAGICGMFSPDNDLSSNRAIQRQRAVDYIRRELDFAVEVGAGYMLVVPGAVGRACAYDDVEFERSVETLRIVADDFAKAKIKAAIEPIRSAEVSFCHTIKDAKKYIEVVNHKAIKNINGDLYHMQVEESHLGEAIIDAGSQLTNLHMADSNRCALGDGSMDIETIIMALYVIGYTKQGCYCTPEPLGPGGGPYPAMYGKPNVKQLDRLVKKSAEYFRQRENVLLGQ